MLERADLLKKTFNSLIIFLIIIYYLAIEKLKILIFS